MNGRIYDPLLGRFLSADVLVQAPGNLQSYNRYSYVGNNPLSLVDPSGFEAGVAGAIPTADEEKKRLQEKRESDAYSKHAQQMIYGGTGAADRIVASFSSAVATAAANNAQTSVTPAKDNLEGVEKTDGDRVNPSYAKSDSSDAPVVSLEQKAHDRRVAIRQKAAAIARDNDKARILRVVLISISHEGFKDDLQDIERIGAVTFDSRKLEDEMLIVTIADYADTEGDTPPLGAVSDALNILPLMDGAIYAIRFNGAKRGAVQRCAQRLRSANIPVFGAVMNDMKAGFTGAYYYMDTNSKAFKEYYDPKLQESPARATG